MMHKTAILPAIVAAALLATAANAAPIAPLAGVTPVETVRFGLGDHPLMYGDNWRYHQRQWDAIEGRGANARAPSCARLRSYDRATHTYRGKSGRRVPCP